MNTCKKIYLESNEKYSSCVIVGEFGVNEEIVEIAIYYLDIHITLM